MKNYFLISAFALLVFTSCMINAVRNPTHKYLYIDHKLISAPTKYMSELAAAKKSNSRQSGHIRYDIVKITEQFVFPRDTNVFKQIVKEVAGLQNSDLKIDSISVSHCVFSDPEYRDRMVGVSGKVFSAGSKKGRNRFWDANLNTATGVMTIGSYRHLKF